MNNFNDKRQTRREVLRLLGGTATVAVAGSGSVAAQSGNSGSFTVTDPVKIESFDGTVLFASLFEPTAEGPHPAMLMTHGFGGQRSDVRPWAEMYARNGYVVLTYDSRGFGQSGGIVHVNGPKEIKDAQRLITYLATDVESVRNDGPESPRVGMDGLSYGGGIQLLTAAAEGVREGLPESDDRIDAIVPRWTWNDLVYSMAPNGVLKEGWPVLLLVIGETGSRDQGDIEKRLKGLTPELYQYFITATLTGELSPEAVAFFRERSPAYDTGLGSLADITTPALFIQGWPDTLFFPNAAVRNARVLEDNGIPTSYVFFEGGHTIPPGVSQRQKTYNDTQALRWIESHVGGGGTSQSVPKLSYFEPQSDALRTANAFPPTDTEERTFSLSDAPTASGDSTFIPPATTQPAAPTFDFPIERETEFIGVPNLTVTVDPLGTEDALFFGFYRVTSDGEEIGPFSGQITPLEIESTLLGGTQTVTLDAVAFQRRIMSGERLRLRVSTLSTLTDGAAKYRPSAVQSLGTSLHHSSAQPSTVTIPTHPVNSND
jgi:ABC-2 type transport system ATP-binding protein